VANLKAIYQEQKGPKLSSYQFSELNRTIQDLAHQEKQPTPVIYGPPQDPSQAKEGPQEAPSLPAENLPPQAEEGGEGSAEPIEQKGLLNTIGQAVFDQEESLELMTVEIRDLGRAILDREQVMSPEQMTYILESRDHFESNMNLEVTMMIYYPIGRELHIKAKNNLLVWLTLDAPYKEQIDKMKAIYEAAELNKEDLVYIDLRIREKVIYCPRGSACQRLGNNE